MECEHNSIDVLKCHVWYKGTLKFLLWIEFELQSYWKSWMAQYIIWTSEVTSVTQSAQAIMLGPEPEASAWMTYSKNRKWSKAEELLLILISYLSPLLINATLVRSHNLHVVDRIDKSRVLCHQFIDQCSATNPSTKYYLNKTDNRQTLWLNGGIMTHQLQ